MGTVKSIDKNAHAAEAASRPSSHRALSASQIVAGVFVLVLILGLVKSLG